MLATLVKMYIRTYQQFERILLWRGCAFSGRVSSLPIKVPLGLEGAPSKAYHHRIKIRSTYQCWYVGMWILSNNRQYCSSSPICLLRYLSLVQYCVVLYLFYSCYQGTQKIGGIFEGNVLKKRPMRLMADDRLIGDDGRLSFVVFGSYVFQSGYFCDQILQLT